MIINKPVSSEKFVFNVHLERNNLVNPPIFQDKILLHRCIASISPDSVEAGIIEACNESLKVAAECAIGRKLSVTKLNVATAEDGRKRMVLVSPYGPPIIRSFSDKVCVPFSCLDHLYRNSNASVEVELCCINVKDGSQNAFRIVARFNSIRMVTRLVPDHSDLNLEPDYDYNDGGDDNYQYI